MTKKDRTMLAVVFAVVLLGGFWMLILSPQRKAAVEAQGRVDTARSALSAAQQQLSSAQAAEDEFRRDRTTVVKLGRIVPETDDIPTLLTQLSALAKKEKVSFTGYAVKSGATSAAPAESSTETSTAAAPGTADERESSTDAIAPLFPPGSVQITGGLGRTPISLDLKGRYFALERYLRAVQRFAVVSQKQSTAKGRLMIVDAFSYDFDDGEGNVDKDHPVLKANLSASIYFAPPLEAPAAAAATAGGATPAASTAAGTASTGAATIGGLR